MPPDPDLIATWRRLLSRKASFVGEAQPEPIRPPGRNELCPCGSGRKYKKCHLRVQTGMDPPTKLAAIPLGLLAATWRSGAEGYNLCFQPGCTRPGIRAHSIQRARTLERIADDRHRVLTFDVQPDARDHQRLRTVGIRSASTFPGFCAEHDSAVFRPVEDSPFQATAEQCFLLAFRALAQMHTFKVIDLRGKGEISKLLSEKKVVDPRLEWLSWSAAYTLKAILDLAEHLIEANLVHGFGLFDEWTTCVMRFTGNLCVAGVGCIGPETGIAGEPLQNTRDLDKRMEIVCHSVIALENDRHAVVFSWPASESVGRRVAEGIAGRGTSAGDAFLEYMFLNHSNVFFARDWWERQLEDDMRAWLGVLAGTMAGEPPSRAVVMKSGNERRFLPWRLEGIEWIEGNKGKAAYLASLVRLGKIDQAVELMFGPTKHSS